MEQTCETHRAVFVARQPILDESREPFGYELLFRSGLENCYTGKDPDQSTLDVIANTFIEIGLDQLTGGKPGLVNFTRALLVDKIPMLLPPDMVIVEILEDVTADQGVLEACREFKSMGYTLAMDDFVLGHMDSPLLEFADIVKVDFMQTTEAQRQEIAEMLISRAIQPLAEKVETHEEFQAACEVGYRYFQGYFFGRPHIHSSHSVDANKLSLMRLLEAVQRPGAGIDDLEQVIRSDVGLTYKLLRFINSAWFGLRHKVGTVRHALSWLGAKETRKWVSMVTLRGLGEDSPSELLVQALTRARLGELLAEQVGLRGHGSDLFLVGLLSVLDALLDMPMEEIVEQVPVNDDVRNALLGRDGRLSDLYRTILAFERGDWDAFSTAASRVPVEEGLVPTAYREALEWAESVLAST